MRTTADRLVARGVGATLRCTQAFAPHQAQQLLTAACMGDARLDDIRAALATLSHDDLTTVLAVAGEGPRVPHALATWVQHAIAWEGQRRDGRVGYLAPPAVLIGWEEITDAVLALAVLANRFQVLKGGEACEAFLCAVGRALMPAMPDK